MLRFKKIVSLVLVVVCLISTIAVIAPTNVSAATSSTYIIPGEYRLESAAKSKVMWNLYGNYSASCTKICTWKKDDSPEQIVVIQYEGDGAYRIYFKDHSTKCTDVLRYTSPLKSGQKIELYEDNDDIAQLVVPYKVNEYTVIFRMKANPSLAISVNKTSNGSQLVLKPFNASDKKQQWVFRSTDSSFKKVSAFTTNEPGGAPTVTMPASMYSLTGIAYTIDGVSFRQAQLVKDLGTSASTSVGTLFWLDMENYIVTDPGTLDKLMDLVLINEIRPNLVSILEGWQSAATGYYDVFTTWTQIGGFGNVMGTSLGVAVGAAATGGVSLADVNIEVLGTVADPENVAASAYLGMVRVYATNVMDCANEGIKTLQKQITSYEDAQYAMNLYALVSANQAALEYLAGGQVREIADSKWYDFTANYLWEVILGFAGSVIPDIPAAEMAWYITNGSASLLDFGMSSGVLSAYDEAYAKSNGHYLGNTYPAIHQAARDLAAQNTNRWDALVGTTVASIFKANGTFTKWYGSQNPLTNIDLEGQCTWYAWGRFYEVTGIRLDYANNAYRWLKDSAKDADVIVVYGANSILPQSVAVDTGGKYGHVLFVEHITYNADGTPKDVYFSEANWDSNGRYDAGRDCVLQKLSFLDFVSQKSPDGYIAAK